jgi:hypothetical protein
VTQDNTLNRRGLSSTDLVLKIRDGMVTKPLSGMYLFGKECD